MFKRLNDFNSVQNQIIYNSILFATTYNKDLIVYDLELGSYVSKAPNLKDIRGFVKNRDTVIGLKKLGGFYFYDTNSKSFIPQNPSNDIYLGQDNCIGNDVIAYKGKLNNRVYGLYSLKEKTFVWSSKEFTALQRIDQNIFSQKKFILFKHSAINGDVEWKLDFKTIFPELKNEIGIAWILGVVNYFIIVEFRNIDKVICLDTRSCELIWKKNIFGKGNAIDHSRGVMHTFLINYIQRCIKTGIELKSKVNRDYFTKIGIESQRSNYILERDYIITTDDRTGTIGAFNLNSLEFDWVDKSINVSYPAGRYMTYSDPYLIVFDAKNSIHIFKRQTL